MNLYEMQDLIHGFIASLGIKSLYDLNQFLCELRSNLSLHKSEIRFEIY